MKFIMWYTTIKASWVAPVRERGLKYHIIANFNITGMVAPVRERGLKYCQGNDDDKKVFGRSREGAWIEIPEFVGSSLKPGGRSREGAWIEIDYHDNSKIRFLVAPVRERGLK